jgi:hypothetical protein
MSMMYLVLAPIAILSLLKSYTQIAASIKERNYSKLKADLFFLGLIITLIIVLIFVIEN